MIKLYFSDCLTKSFIKKTEINYFLSMIINNTDYFVFVFEVFLSLMKLLMLITLILKNKHSIIIFSINYLNTINKIIIIISI